MLRSAVFRTPVWVLKRSPRSKGNSKKHTRSLCDCSPRMAPLVMLDEQVRCFSNFGPFIADSPSRYCSSTSLSQLGDARTVSPVAEVFCKVVTCLRREQYRMVIWPLLQPTASQFRFRRLQPSALTREMGPIFRCALHKQWCHTVYNLTRINKMMRYFSYLMTPPSLH